MPKCGHCNGRTTRMIEISPANASFKQNAVCCSTCDSILGVVGYYDAGTLLQNQKSALEQIAGTVSQIQQDVRHLQHDLQNLRR